MYNGPSKHTAVMNWMEYFTFLKHGMLVMHLTISALVVALFAVANNLVPVQACLTLMLFVKSKIAYNITHHAECYFGSLPDCKSQDILSLNHATAS